MSGIPLHISETLQSRIGLVPAFIAAVMGKLCFLPFEQKASFDIKLALQEAVINAMKHGNKLNAALVVKVDIQAQERQLTIEVTDQGPGFDYTSIPNPILPENLEKMSGRGIFLIQNAMDHVEFEDHGRTIRMTKNF
ncbi:MAG: ATP-binding protein [Candidatus Omnitrophica bacterium]|nr:ATP-binding protein [Candidatus Omnitrophota bacterium]